VLYLSFFSAYSCLFVNLVSFPFLCCFILVSPHSLLNTSHSVQFHWPCYSGSFIPYIEQDGLCVIAKHI
jgi:hypothetical protein